MTVKKFSKELYNKYDNFARDKLKNFLKTQLGWIAVDNPDQYGVDLIVYKDSKKIGYVEVEVKTCWSGEFFQFPNLNILKRKDKLLKNDMQTIFAMVNKEGTFALICEDKTILNSPLENVPNKYLQEELFYKVSLDNIKKISL